MLGRFRGKYIDVSNTCGEPQFSRVKVASEWPQSGLRVTSEWPQSGLRVTFELKMVKQVCCQANVRNI
jgi:hypothetical protein